MALLEWLDTLPTLSSIYFMFIGYLRFIRESCTYALDFRILKFHPMSPS
jgi:hypothetical protein